MERRRDTLVALAGGLCLLGAVAVRSLPPVGPGGGGASLGTPEVAEPMQLLRAGGGHRVAELDRRVPDALRGRWLRTRRDVARLEGCPDLAPWLDGSDGQRAEALVSELAASGREGGYAALVVLFDLARRTSWAPGAFGSSHGAERLGELLAAWLDAWAPSAAEDPLLREPALAAVLVYGRAMAAAAGGNLFSSSPPSRERARRNLERWLGAAGSLTGLGAALASRYPEALAGALVAAREGEDGLEGLAREAELWFPDLDGACGG